MGWKELSNCLKGGIIGLSASMVYLAILMFLEITNFGRSALSGGLNILFFPVSLVINGYCNTFVFPTQRGQLSCDVSIPWLIFIIIITLIGAGIGYVVTKLKK